MTLNQWHNRIDLKEKLQKLLQTEELKSALEVMKDMNRPKTLDSVSVDGKIDPTAHAIVHATLLGYDQAIRDLQENLTRTELVKAKFTEKPFQYIKEIKDRLTPPPLISERKK